MQLVHTVLQPSSKPIPVEIAGYRSMSSCGSPISHQGVLINDKFYMFRTFLFAHNTTEKTFVVLHEGRVAEAS